MAAQDLLYLTNDGLLEPLIFSQVVRVLEALAARGWRYRVVSLEKSKDLSDERRVRELRLRLDASRIGWTFARFEDRRSPTAALTNANFLLSSAYGLASRGAVRGIHARGYLPGVAALAATTSTGLPWVFDARGYWVDERIEEGRWFTSPISVGAARGIEHQLYAKSSAVITLTELHAQDVRQQFGGSRADRPVQCITTLADFSDFRPRGIPELSLLPAWVVERLEGLNVLAIIGSINRSYLVDETVELARRAVCMSPQTHLLILTAQREEYARRLEAAQFPLGRFTIERSAHVAMPVWLSLVNWCPLLLQPASRAKRASMPTKLAELLASGVRPIQYGCNQEVEQWVRVSGAGFVMTGVDENSIVRAAERIVAGPTRQQSREISEVRSRVEEHFSLASGVLKYEEVLQRVFGTPSSI
jgi:glycosyltransferase involved in cell wall biosynthesis